MQVWQRFSYECEIIWRDIGVQRSFNINVLVRAHGADVDNAKANNMYTNVDNANAKSS